MNRTTSEFVFDILNGILDIKTIQFNETTRKELVDGSIKFEYTVALTVFYDETNFTVNIYDFEDKKQSIEALVSMAIRKLKQIANEKDR